MRRMEGDGRKIGAVAEQAARFDKHVLGGADKALQPARPFIRAGCAQLGGATFNNQRINLWHPRGRRAGARRIWEDMAVNNAAIPDQRDAFAELLVGLCRKSCDDVRADRDVWPRSAETVCQRDGFCAVMTTLHAFEDHIASRLKREMDVRHDTLVVRKKVDESLIHL